MPTIEAPLSTEVTEKPIDPAERLPIAPRPQELRQGSRSGSSEAFQRCLDLAVTGNRAANRTIRRFAATVEKVAPFDSVGPARQLELLAAGLEMTQRLAHAPFDLGRGFVQSAVLVDVDVDVDVGSRHSELQARNQEECHDITPGQAQVESSSEARQDRTGG